jgi:hypothetical protein
MAGEESTAATVLKNNKKLETYRQADHELTAQLA